MARRPATRLNLPKLPPSPLLLFGAWIAVMIGFAQGLFDFLPEPPPPMDTDAVIVSAYDRIAHGDAGAALSELRLAARAVGETAVVLVGMGQAYLDMGDLEAAENHLVRGILQRQEELMSALSALDDLRNDLLARGGHGEDTAAAVEATDRVQAVLSVWPDSDPLMARAYETLSICCDQRAHSSKTGAHFGIPVVPSGPDLLAATFNAPPTTAAIETVLPATARRALLDATGHATLDPKQALDGGAAADERGAADASESGAAIGNAQARAQRYYSYAGACRNQAARWRGE